MFQQEASGGRHTVKNNVVEINICLLQSQTKQAPSADLRYGEEDSISPSKLIDAAIEGKVRN